MLIKMICGICGLIEEGVVTAKTNQSDPFEIEEKRAMQLIAQGYATPVGVAGEEAESTVDQHTDVGMKQLTDYSTQELKKMAKNMGLSTAGTKEQLIERIEAGFKLKEENDADNHENYDGEEDAGGDTEAPPTLQPAEPE